MKFVEAVNLIESRYGMQAFDHLEDYSEDEAVQILLEERKQSRAKNNKKCARGKDPGPFALKKMIEGGYAYVDIAAATGLGMTAVRAKTKKYGLRELYHQMHPNVRRFDVKVSCVNRSTGERREYKTMSAAERALGLYHCALSQNTKNGKAFVHGNWEFRRAN